MIRRQSRSNVTLWLELFGLGVVICFTSSQAQATEVGVIEREAGADLAKSSAPVAELLNQSELLIGSGRLGEAVPVLAQAAELLPHNALIARTNCRVLTALKQTQPAVEMCRRALVNELTQKEWPGDMLAMVRALLSSPKGATTEQLYQAISISNSLEQKIPNQPWPHLAQCEIASRLGHWNALQMCDSKFRGWAIANAHYDPAKGLASLRRQRVWMWSAWLGLAAFCLATLAHALRKRFITGVRSKVVQGATCIAIVASVLAPGRALAQPKVAPKPGDLGATAINDKDPESSVPTTAQRDRDPLGYAYFVMDITARAEKAVKHEDFQSAVRYYRALVKAVPNKSISYSKLCSAYESMQDWPNALENCRTALGYEGVNDGDYAKYTHLLLEHRTRPSPNEIQDLDAIVQQLRTATPASSTADVVECEVGLKLHDKSRLQRCATNLSKSNPTDPKTLSFEWAYAVERGDYNGAKSFLGQLRQAAVSPASLKSMEEVTSAAGPVWKRALRGFWLILVVVGTAVAVVLVLIRRRQPQQSLVSK